MPKWATWKKSTTWNEEKNYQTSSWTMAPCQNVQRGKSTMWHVMRRIKKANLLRGWTIKSTAWSRLLTKSSKWVNFSTFHSFQMLRVHNQVQNMEVKGQSYEDVCLRQVWYTMGPAYMVHVLFKKKWPCKRADLISGLLTNSTYKDTEAPAYSCHV